jgi:hypothetical protein
MSERKQAAKLIEYEKLIHLKKEVNGMLKDLL